MTILFGFRILFAILLLFKSLSSFESAQGKRRGKLHAVFVFFDSRIICRRALYPNMAREILWPVIRPNAFYRAKDAGKTDEKAGKTGGKMFCGVSLSVKSLRGKGAPPVRRIPLGKSGVLDFSGDICAPGVEWA